MPYPLVEENVYYVVNINGTNDTFQVAATRGGNPIIVGDEWEWVDKG